MQVLVTFRHIRATEALRQYAEGKIDKLLKYMHRPIEAHVIFSIDKHHKHRQFAEIILTADHGTFNAKEETADLYSAMDLATSKIERQVKKLATKRQTRKHASGNEVEAPPVPAGRRPRLRSQRVPVEPMTVREALRRAAQAEAELLIFHNLESEMLNVLHRRKDGSYVLLEPESVER